MRIRTTVITIAALTGMLTACSSSDDSTDAKPKATTSAAAEKSAGLTAKRAASKLADATGVTTLGDPTDNTSSCSNKAAGRDPSPNDCSQLITTDTVSIYEFKTPKVSAHWVSEMKKQGDWRQVDRFALAWTARSQKLTSDDRRAELVAALKKAAAEEA